MSFSDIELDAHCHEIITDPAIRNRIVVLCEGDSKPFKQTERAASIKELAEKTQDSAFYYRAIPTWWKETRKYEPVFRICGTQTNVIKAYFKLLEIHQNNPLTSYLNPNRLFAFVDIDVQKLRLPNSYPFKNLEDIYCDLYLNGKVNDNTKTNHKIWVTGLLHKESYFLIPELEIKNLFDNYQPAPLFNNQIFNFETVYLKILETMLNHSDIENNFYKAMTRIAYCKLFKQCKSIAEFQEKWRNSFDNANTEEKDNLIYILLTVTKSKCKQLDLSVWENIKSSNETEDNKNYRDELCFKIARDFYAKEERNSPHHLPSFFNALSAIA